jgi:hypothetical protein
MRWRENCSNALSAGLVVAFLTVGILATVGEPRLNQIQVIGSHNSYHVTPGGAIRELLSARNAQRAQGLDDGVTDGTPGNCQRAAGAGA